MAGEAIIVKCAVALVGEGLFPLRDLQPLACFIYHIWLKFVLLHPARVKHWSPVPELLANRERWHGQQAVGGVSLVMVGLCTLPTSMQAPHCCSVLPECKSCYFRAAK